MPEGNSGHEISDDASFREIIETEVGGSFPSLLKFDTSRNQLYDRLAELAIQIPELLHAGERQDIDIAEVNDSFEELVKSVYTEDGMSAVFLDTVLDLILSDSRERISMMRAALDESSSMADFKHDSLKALMSDLIDVASSDDEALDNLVTMYNYDLSRDIESYVEQLVHKSHQSPSEPNQESPSTLEIKKELKDHVTDVAKIVAGVTIALTLDRLLRR